MFALLAQHRRVLFPAALFADLFPSGRGRPSVPADIASSILVLQALHGLSDREAMAAVRTDLRWKVACGLPVGHGGFDASTLTYWRRRLAAYDRPDRISHLDCARRTAPQALMFGSLLVREGLVNYLEGVAIRH